jgi:hypothetical protein
MVLRRRHNIVFEYEPKNLILSDKFRKSGFRGDVLKYHCFAKKAL